MAKHPSVTRRLLAALCTLVLAAGVTAPPPAAAYNFGFAPSTTSSGGTASQCSGTTYEGPGASGSSSSITLPAGECLVYLDSPAATDSFGTLTITLSPTHTDGTTSFGFITDHGNDPCQNLTQGLSRTVVS